MTPFRHLLIWYVLIITITSLILITPIALKPGQSINWIDALFISVSAISDTGLTTVSISETFNGFGQSIALILIQLGGIGWFALKILFFTYIFKGVTHKQIKETKYELATAGKQQTLSIVKVASVVTIGATLIFGVTFGIIFATVEPVANNATIDLVDPNLKGNWGSAMWTGIFHAGSSINNAGLDIIAGDTSLAAYYGNVGIQVLTLILFITGGIGFIIIHDLLKWIKSKKNNQKFKFSLLTKIASISYLIVAIFGLTSVYIIEGINAINDPLNSFVKSASGSEALNWWGLTFNTFSTRNAGFSTIDINILTEPTQFIYITMMYIGSGPGSTAGGLRTTTVAIIILSIISIIRDRRDVSAFNKTIPQKTIKNSFVVLAISLFLVIFSTTLISVTENIYSKNELENKSIFDYLFIVTSAFGTTGLSLINLSELHAFSKVILMFVMLTGQLGLITMIKILKPNPFNKPKVKVEYIEEDIPIGH